MAIDPNQVLYDQSGNAFDPNTFVSNQYRDPSQWDNLAGLWNGFSYDPHNVDVMTNLLHQQGQNYQEMNPDDFNNFRSQYNKQSGFDGQDTGVKYNTGADLAKAFGWNNNQSQPPMVNQPTQPPPIQQNPSNQPGGNGGVNMPINQPPPMQYNPPQIVSGPQPTNQPPPQMNPTQFRGQAPIAPPPSGYLKSYQGMK